MKINLKKKIKKQFKDRLLITNTKMSNKSKSKKSTSASKKLKSSKKEESPQVVEEVLEETKETQPELVVKRNNKKTREDVIEYIETLVEEIDNEVSKLRESNDKVKGVRFLRSHRNKLVKLVSVTNRAFKKKRTMKRKLNNSGFLKPVRVSKQMSKFAGWKPEELHSRVEVTKMICKYIKDNNLQNPNDRREILPDSKLSKILDYNSKTAENPLTYFRIQTYIKKHFPKD